MCACARACVRACVRHTAHTHGNRGTIQKEHIVRNGLAHLIANMPAMSADHQDLLSDLSGAHFLRDARDARDAEKPACW